MTSWMPDRLREIADQYDRSVADLRRSVSELTEATSRARKEFEPLTREQQRQLEEHYRSGGAGPELAGIQRRIDAGEFTWADVHQGRVDPAIAEHYYQRLDQIGAMLKAAGEGTDLDTFLAERDRPAPPTQPPAAPREDGDEPRESFLKRDW